MSDMSVKVHVLLKSLNAVPPSGDQIWISLSVTQGSVSSAGQVKGVAVFVQCTEQIPRYRLSSPVSPFLL